MIQEMIRAFMFIFVAEMGDKTQILAMAFATRFPVRKVLLGIGIGAFLNHGLAVLLGSYLSRLVPVNIIQMIAGAAFVGFALWTLKPEKEDDEEAQRAGFGPTATVALAFFMGELGDKTQLTAITLAAGAAYPLMILAGTVSGMLVTGALGIIIGKKLGDKIPELGIKLAAASVFMFFGLQKLFTAVPERFLSMYVVVPFVLVLAFIVWRMVYALVLRRRLGIQSDLIAKSKLLHDYYRHMKEDLGKLCMGSEYCKACRGNQCIIGQSKEIIDTALSDRERQSVRQENGTIRRDKPFTEEEVLDSLVDTLWLIGKVRDDEKSVHAHYIRNQLETILLGQPIEKFENLDAYISEVRKKDALLSERINRQYRMRKPVEERLINAGNRISNMYLVETQNGYLLIDTGYEEQFERFKKALKKKHVSIEDISYIFITHAHDDHVGFLHRMLNETKAKVILHPESVRRLKAGQNSFDGGCSSIVSKVFFRLMKLLGKGEHRFPPVDAPERFLIVTKETKPDIEKLLSAKIVALPGHTKDSMGLLFENRVLFCGDAAMNGLPGRNHVIIWIEELKDYIASWKTMMDLDCKKVYPSHGKPFSKERLNKYEKKLEKIHLYPVKPI